MTNQPREIGPAINVDGNRLVARLVIPKDADPEASSELALRALAREKSVEVTPEVDARIRASATEFAEKGGPIETDIARASQAEDGTPARIEWQPGFDPTGTASPNAPADAAPQGEAISFYDIQSFVRVKKGNFVARFHHATSGQDGRDVLGNTVQATPGKKLGLKIDPSLLIEDGGKLVAQIDGVLKQTHNALRVDPVLDINGTVDFSTGNIDFDGDVHIHHDIRDKFRVKATKGVVIEGLIDASHIECAGDLHARRGAAGREIGTINVGGDAEVGYLAQVTTEVGGHLKFGREIVQCRTTVRGDLESESGSLIGGLTRVYGSVRLAEIGSASEPPTHLVLGPDPVAQADSPEADKLAHSITQMKGEVDSLKAAAGNRNATAAERLTELEFEIADAEAQLAALKPDTPALPQREPSAIEVRKAIHGRVRIEIEGHHVELNETLRGPVRIWLEKDAIVFSRDDGKAKLLLANSGARAA